MNAYLLTIFALIGISQLSAQTTDLGKPKSYAKSTPELTKDHFIAMPGFDLDIIQNEDAINDQQKNRPWRFGYKYETNFNLQNSGEWIDIEQGRLWRIGIICPDAITINVLIKDYYLPEGASLYLFDESRSNYVGAYTSRNNRADSLLGTEMIVGEKLVLEYFEPTERAGEGSFTVENVIHGYRSVQKSLTVQSETLKTLNASGDCNIDVHCPLGTGWEDQIRSVAMIVVSGNAVCSGALINNTCNDGTPYFLTANHCLSGNVGSWAFRFNWASPPGTESCATTSPSTDPGPPYDETANGATVLANDGQSDFALLQIDNMTVTDAQTWNLFYAGWNNDDTNGSITQATGIHHPSGDVMKICREDDSPYHSTSGSAEVWWIDAWDQGVTEPGSSGSPLFDQNGRIIGQLYGGLAACAGTVNNGDYDYYGRFGISWNLGVSDYLASGCGGPVPTNDGWDPSGPGLPDDAGIQSILSPNGLYCEDSIYPSIRLRNLGSNDLTSVMIYYNLDGGANLSYSWTGLLQPNNTEVIDLPGMVASAGSHVFNTFTSDPNGVTDTDPNNDAAYSDFEIQTGGILTYVTITTDCYGHETYWEIEDGSATVVASGGNPIGIPPGGLQVASGGDPGAYPDEATIEEKLCLAVGCYDFTIYDDWGDGVEGSWFCQDGGYEITNTSGTILASIQNVAFGNSEMSNFCVVDNASLNELDGASVSLYPNPTDDFVTIKLEGRTDGYSYQVSDLAGRILQTNNIVNGSALVDLSSYSDGIYLINIRGGSGQFTSHIIKQ